MSVRDEDVLPAPLLAALLAGVGPQRPNGVAAERIKRNLTRRITTPAQIVLRASGWRPFVADTEMKILFDDGVSRSWLVRMQPGSQLPPHGHDDGDEECVVLEGEVWVDGRRYRPGDYTIALRGSRHDSVRTETGALFFLRGASPPSAQARRE